MGFGHIGQRPNQCRHDEAAARWEARRPIIIELYVKQGLSQTVVAKELGVSQRNFSMWVRRMGLRRGSGT